jgi:hypothetical protein
MEIATNAASDAGPSGVELESAPAKNHLQILEEYRNSYRQELKSKTPTANSKQKDEKDVSTLFVSLSKQDEKGSLSSSPRLLPANHIDVLTHQPIPNECMQEEKKSVREENKTAHVPSKMENLLARVAAFKERHQKQTFNLPKRDLVIQSIENSSFVAAAVPVAASLSKSDGKTSTSSCWKAAFITFAITICSDESVKLLRQIFAAQAKVILAAKKSSKEIQENKDYRNWLVRRWLTDIVGSGLFASVASGFVTVVFDPIFDAIGAAYGAASGSFVAFAVVFMAQLIWKIGTARWKTGEDWKTEGIATEKPMIQNLKSLTFKDWIKNLVSSAAAAIASSLASGWALVFLVAVIPMICGYFTRDAFQDSFVGAIYTGLTVDMWEFFKDVFAPTIPDPVKWEGNADNIPNELQCGVCYELIHKAHCLNGWFYCKHCINECQKMGTNCSRKRLPFSRSDIRSSPEMDQFIEEWKKLAVSL